MCFLIVWSNAQNIIIYHVHVLGYTPSTILTRPLTPTTQALLAAHPPHEILGALTRLTAELADEIHSHTDSIDLTRDAQELR